MSFSYGCPLLFSLGGGWKMVFGMIIGIGIIALIVWYVIKYSKRFATESDYNKAPLEIAKERYAKGEITKKQFEDIKKELNKG